MNFIEFYIPAIYVPGLIETRKIKKIITSWNIKKARKIYFRLMGENGVRPYAFRFISKGLGGMRYSGYHYIDGTVETLEKIKAKNDPKNKILIENMECNKWEKVITLYTPYKWTVPFDKNDVVVVWP